MGRKGLKKKTLQELFHKIFSGFFLKKILLIPFRTFFKSPSIFFQVISHEILHGLLKNYLYELLQKFHQGLFYKIFLGPPPEKFRYGLKSFRRVLHKISYILFSKSQKFRIPFQKFRLKILQFGNLKKKSRDFLAHSTRHTFRIVFHSDFGDSAKYSFGNSSCGFLRNSSIMNRAGIYSQTASGIASGILSSLRMCFTVFSKSFLYDIF